MREMVLDAIKRQFPDVVFEVLEGAQPFARLAAPYGGIGDLELHDDGNEVTIDFRHISHTHLNPYRKMPREALANWLAESVVEFLKALFEDRILLYTAVDGLQGGQQISEVPFSRSEPVAGMDGFNCYLWSGPVQRK